MQGLRGGLVKVRGHGGGPGRRLRRGPSPEESVLERSPAVVLGCGMRMEGAHQHEKTRARANGERTPTRKKTRWSVHRQKLGWGKGTNKKRRSE
jgi:hypothetical protein